MKEAPVLSEEKMEQVYKDAYTKACKFSEKYENTLSPKNWNPNRPADRQRCFNSICRPEIQRVTAQAQNDDDHKHYQGIIREIFEEIEKYPNHKLQALMTSEDWQSLKSKYQEEK